MAANLLDDVVKIESLDPRDMHRLIYEFSAQLQEAAEIAQRTPIRLPAGIPLHNIVVTGLGGSAIGGDLVRSYLSEELKIPLLVNRDYFLPAFTSPSTLCIASSYSGNTEETLSAYADAKAKGARIVCITSGGTLEQKARADGFPVFKIPSGYPPRAALGFSAMSLLCCLASLGLIADKSADIKESIALTAKLREEYRRETATEKNLAKQLAVKLYGSIPLIYAANHHFDAIALRWKGQMCENAKLIAYSNVLPELNHNEIVGWEFPPKLLSSLSVVILRDAGDYARVQKRMEITKEIIRTKAKEVIEVRTQGNSLLARIFSAVHLGDYVSFYLANLNAVDPTPVAVIDYLKNQLKDA
jgi:glucose/mannose-6-phosphate isomerase